MALFFALDTQWRRAGMSGERLGIDYGAVEPTARMMGVEMTPLRLSDLRIMEAAALEQFARRRP